MQSFRKIDQKKKKQAEIQNTKPEIYLGNRSVMGMRWGQAQVGGRWPDMCFLSTRPGPTSETAHCNLKTILFEPWFYPHLLTPPPRWAPPITQN